MGESGIYSIEHIESGKKYIGSAINVSTRMSEHLLRLKNNKHKNKKLQNAWNKHGNDAFVFSVIELVSNDMLIAREQYWIDATKAATRSGYNIAPQAGSTFGFKMSAASKAKIAAARKGFVFTKEQRAKMRASRLGKKHTEATRHKLSIARKKRSITTATIEKMRVSLTGKKASAATRQKMSEAHKGLKRSASSIEASASAHRGAKRSDESRTKMAAAQKNRFATTPPARDSFGRMAKQP